MPEWIDPQRRPRLPEELDRLLPELLGRLSRHGVRATFFVLGEVAERLPERIREIATAGHEVASHGWAHRRASELSLADFASEAQRSRQLLEQITGRPVCGFRAPEWSFRVTSNRRLQMLAELGFQYDSSLTRALGAGSVGNPRQACRLEWPTGASLVEFPPLLWRDRPRLPASGWTARLAPQRWILKAARREVARGGLALFTVHPWELTARPTPVSLLGLARLFHDAGRTGFSRRFDHLLEAGRFRPLAEWLGADETQPLDGDDTAVTPGGDDAP